MQTVEFRDGTHVLAIRRGGVWVPHTIHSQALAAVFAEMYDGEVFQLPRCRVYLVKIEKSVTVQN